MASANLFAGLTKEDRDEVLSFFKVSQFQPNERIVTMGEKGTELYYIHTGHVTVKVDKGLVAELGPGDTFGEVCLADGGLRTASVFAVDEVRTLTLDGPSLDELARKRPLSAAILLLNLLRLLGAKLRNADSVIDKHLARERDRQNDDEDSIVKRILGKVG